jgi:ParB/RepB/Spo0J family partition protein
MKGRFTRAQIRDIKYHSLRQSNGSDEELKGLGKSWLHRPIHPIVLRQDMTVADGHRRIAGLKLLGETEVDVFITDEKLTDAQLTEIGLATAIHRATLSPPEMALALERLLREDTTLTQKSLCAKLDLQEATVSRLLSVAKNPLTRELFLSGQLNLTLAAEIASAAPDAQAGLLNFAMSGPVTREQLVARKRKPAAEGEPKLGRVVFPVSTATKVTVTGEAITLEKFVEILSLAMEAAKRAIREKISIASAQKVWSDRAKAGA